MKIFVGNIPTEGTVEELRTLFEYYGTVRECDIIRHYGFVHMDSPEEAAQAIAALNQYELHGQKLNVAESRPRPSASATAMAVTKVYVGSLAPSCSNQELRAKFEEYGRVVECDIVKDYAFVHMEKEEDAIKAIGSLDGQDFLGNKLRVQLSRSTYGKSGGQREVCQRCGRQGHQARDCHSLRLNQYNQYQLASQYYPSYYSYYDYDYSHGSYYDYYEDYQAATAAAGYTTVDYTRERSPNRLAITTAAAAAVSAAAATNSCTQLYERTRLSPLTVPKYQAEKYMDDSISRYVSVARKPVGAVGHACLTAQVGTAESVAAAAAANNVACVTGATWSMVPPVDESTLGTAQISEQ
ncbi:RNA-binding protein 4-like [Amblyraja radiata]|uniref:RNA-binding protein 4-like n=1 Tax=Amblyraja radiata TaxID=386614 RepID=UPI001402D3BC|nr:RNA-binding protein 4-like [Amblyraja radiata]